MTKRTVQALLLAAVILSLGAAAQAQSWDKSGNGLLSGPYYVRHVVWLIGDQEGDLNDALSIYGEITFTASSGTYVFNGNLVDASAGEVVAYTNITGTYTIAANGYGFMDSLVNSYAGISETVFGLVSNGIFIGSSTENLSGQGLNDLEIMAPIASPIQTNATFKGSYSFVDLDSPVTGQQGAVAYARDSLFSGTADGNGNFTGFTGSGYIVNNNGSATRQTGSAKYSFQNGAGNILFGGSLTSSNVTSTLIAGNHYVYISPDGNFIFGGSPNGWDIFVGVRAGGGAPSEFQRIVLSGRHGSLDFTNASNSVVDIDNYYGSFNATSGTILAHQRLFQSSVQQRHLRLYVPGWLHVQFGRLLEIVPTPRSTIFTGSTEGAYRDRELYPGLYRSERCAGCPDLQRPGRVPQSDRSRKFGQLRALHRTNHARRIPDACRNGHHHD